MRIDSLQLRNFRGFRELDLRLHPQLTVLIGENGSGKSSIVRALEIGGMAAVDARYGRRLTAQDSFVTDDDIRVGADRAECTITHGSETTTFAWVQGEPPDAPSRTTAEVPLVLSFPTDRGRLFTPRIRREDGRVATSATLIGRGSASQPAFDDLQPGFTSFEFFEIWFRERENLENQMRVETKNLEASDPALQRVRESVTRVLPELSSPRIDRSRPSGRGRSQLVFTKGDESFSAHMLSDGERSLIVLVTSIAKHLAQVNEAEPVGRSVGGATVVIDEVELHLHPRWQREVVPRLLKAFPHSQFVLTTHSPQVVGSVPHESLRVLESFRLHGAPHPTKGRDSNAILEEIMGATVRDRETAAALDEAARLVEWGSREDAEAAVHRLGERFGEDDREVVRLRTELRLRDPA
ncbi:MAG: AAA family ATPase [Myxococcota bacterium]